MSQMPPMTPNYSGPVPGAAKPAGLAVTAMVLGICSFALCWVPYLNFLTLITALVAIILGAIARSQAKKGLAGGAGMALTGLILGVVYLSIFVILLVIGLVFGMQFLNWAKSEAERQRQIQQQQKQGGQSGSLMPMLAQHAQAMWNILTTLVLR
jgi:Domain of unknown function (DUF4190)